MGNRERRIYGRRGGATPPPEFIPDESEMEALLEAAQAEPEQEVIPGDFFRADPSFVRREKLRAQELRASQWWKNRRSSGVCYYCGGKFPPAELTMDHLIPVSRGGRSIRANVVPCCKECNNRKRYLMPTEWQEYLQRLGAPGNPPSQMEQDQEGASQE